MTVQKNQLVHQTIGIAPKMVAAILVSQMTNGGRRSVARVSAHRVCQADIVTQETERASSSLRLLPATGNLRPEVPLSNQSRPGPPQHTFFNQVLITTCLLKESLLQAGTRPTSSGPIGSPGSQLMGRSQSSQCRMLSSGAKQTMVGSATTTVAHRMMHGAAPAQKKETMKWLTCLMEVVAIAIAADVFSRSEPSCTSRMEIRRSIMPQRGIEQAASPGT